MLRQGVRTQGVGSKECEALQGGMDPGQQGSADYRFTDVDKYDRKQALKEGHTHPLAVQSAVTANGKRIGHVRC